MNKRVQSKIALKERKIEYFKTFSERLGSLSERVSVILVYPKYQGNIGAIARLMKNSGLTDLRLVSDKSIEDEALFRAMNGRQLLEKAKKFASFEDAVRGFTVIAATSSSPTFSDRRFLRLPASPEGFWKTNLTSMDKIALVFGREDDGLRNEEIELCNAFIYIPANPEYPVFNLSHAVSIILYEMMRQLPESNPEMADPISPENFSLMMESFIDLLEKAGYPDYKKPNTEMMVKRIASRANLTESEFYKIMGILRYLKYLDEGKNTDSDSDAEAQRI